MMYACNYQVYKPILGESFQILIGRTVDFLKLFGDGMSGSHGIARTAARLAIHEVCESFELTNHAFKCFNIAILVNLLSFLKIYHLIFTEVGTILEHAVDLQYAPVGPEAHTANIWNLIWHLV